MKRRGFLAAVAALVAPAPAERLCGEHAGDLLPVPREWKIPRSIVAFASDEMRFEAGPARGLPMVLDAYQSGILDAFEGVGVRSVRLLAGAQAGKTECMLAVIGHGIGEVPAEMMVVQPTERPSAEKFAKQRIDPLIAASELLDSLVSGKRSAGKGNSVAMKVFPGGYLSIAGASAPAGLASMPAAILLADEVDKWPLSVGAKGAKQADQVEGDPLQLARRRQHGYGGMAREMLASTPTTVEARIWSGWLAGDRCVWYVACPHCFHAAPMTWGDHELQPGHGPGAHVVRQHDGLGACMTCGSCSAPWSLLERIAASRLGAWVPTADPTATGARSFYMWRAMSSWGHGLDKAWEERVAANERSAAGDPTDLREWRQGVLGTPSRNSAEDYPAIVELRKYVLARARAVRAQAIVDGADRDADPAEWPVDAWAPAASLIRTGAVDVQQDCLHVLLVGWKRTGTGWILRRATIEGDPTEVDDPCWEAAFEWFAAREPAAINIDSGFVPSVVDEIVDRWGAGLATPIKGTDTGRFVRPPELPEARIGHVDKFRRLRGPDHVRRIHDVWTVGTSEGKRQVMARLSRPSDDPRTIHPAPWMGKADVNELISEHEVDVVSPATGRSKRQWKRVQRHNHLLDLTVYALHAFRRLLREER